MELLTNEIEVILTEWMETNGTDSVIAYIFAALTNACLLNDSYNYRTFHTDILEKFPALGFKSGFDWAEALYNAIINEHEYAEKTTYGFCEEAVVQLSYDTHCLLKLCIQFRIVGIVLH